MCTDSLELVDVLEDGFRYRVSEALSQDYFADTGGKVLRFLLGSKDQARMVVVCNPNTLDWRRRSVSVS